MKCVDVDKLTRIEVLDETGRAYTLWNCKVDLSIQDSERTLKIFVKGNSRNLNSAKSGMKL